MYGFRSKLVCLSKQVKFTDIRKNTHWLPNIVNYEFVMFYIKGPWLYLSSLVVNPLTHNPKIEVSNPATIKNRNKKTENKIFKNRRDLFSISILPTTKFEQIFNENL
jgi:hypothetical protein